jgi:hypothetical protein
MHFVNLIVMFRSQPGACFPAIAGLHQSCLDGLRAHPTAPKKPKASPNSNIGFTATESANYGFYQKTKPNIHSVQLCVLCGIVEAASTPWSRQSKNSL